MTLRQETQKASPDTGYIELFKLDMTMLPGNWNSLLYFTPHFNANGSTVSFGGFAYTSLPINTSGFEWKGDGTQSRPTLSISNVSKVLQSSVLALNDLVGATLTRKRTLTKFLDGAPASDPSQYFPIDLYVIEQKTSHSKLMIEWSLCSVIDRMGVRLPRRQITKQGDSRYGTFPGVGSYRAAGY